MRLFWQWNWHYCRNNGSNASATCVSEVQTLIAYGTPISSQAASNDSRATKSWQGG